MHDCIDVGAIMLTVARTCVAAAGATAYLFAVAVATTAARHGNAQTGCFYPNNKTKVGPR